MPTWLEVIMLVVGLACVLTAVTRSRNASGWLVWGLIVGGFALMAVGGLPLASKLPPIPMR